MTNAQSWEDILQKYSLLPEKPERKLQDEPPKIQTWVRVYPAKSPVKKGSKRP